MDAQELPPRSCRTDDSGSDMGAEARFGSQRSITYLDSLGRVVVKRLEGQEDEAEPTGSVEPMPGMWEAKIAALRDEARVGLDLDRRYADDPAWVTDLVTQFSQYLAGGFGDLEHDDELREFFGELEGLYAELAGVPVKDIAIPEELMRRYVALTFARWLESWREPSGGYAALQERDEPHEN